MALIQQNEHTGMKMTEVGWIPKDWECKSFGKVLKIGHGKDYKHLQFGPIPVYGTGGYMTSVNDYLYDGESACIGRKGTINRPIFLDGRFWTVDTLFYTHSFKDTFPKFVFYAFQQIDWLSYNEATGVPSLTAQKIEEIECAFPPTSEQRRIAQVLSDTDSLIASLSRTIDKKRLVKQGAMQQLLTGKTRLKGFSGEWGENTFEELFKTYSTASYSRDQMGKDGDVLCIHYGDIHVKYGHIVRLALEDVPTITEAQAGKFVRLKDGDIIMADASEDYEGAGKCIAVITNRKEAIAGLHTILLRPKENLKFDSQFTSYLLAGRFVKQQIENLAEGTKVYSISFKKIKDVLVRYPKSLVEQNAIANILTTMDNEIASLEAELQKYKFLKQGMMQKLLTGQIRLTDSTK